jgi:hypothetical protein
VEPTWPATWQESTPSPAAELPSELAGAVAKAVEASQVGLGMGRFSPRKMVIFKMA